MKKFIWIIFCLALFVSCSGDSDGDDNINEDKITSLQIYISDSSVIIGQSLMFSVVDNTGKTRTNEAKFYVNDIEIIGSTHTFNQLGKFNVHATFQGVSSQRKEVTVNPVPIEYKKRVMVEDYTGTWCGWCPRVSYAIELLEQETNDAVIVAAHQGDPMQFSKINSLMSAFSVTGFPTAIINREQKWTSPQPNNVAQVTSKLSQKAYIGLAINPTIDGRNLFINTKMSIGYNYNVLKLGVYIIEDDLEYDQQNYTSYYNGSAVLRGFKHHNVLRASLTHILGDQLPNDKVGHGKDYEKTFNYSIPAQYNKEKIKVVVFVTEGSSKVVLNSRVAKIGENQEIEKKE
tara:strand:+ start:205 stop:1239 length:1035 start_codon:yes stop_codon:yes gene_type:complete